MTNLFDLLFLLSIYLHTHSGSHGMATEQQSSLNGGGRLEKEEEVDAERAEKTFVFQGSVGAKMAIK